MPNSGGGFSGEVKIFGWQKFTLEMKICDVGGVGDVGGIRTVCACDDIGVAISNKK